MPNQNSWIKDFTEFLAWLDGLSKGGKKQQVNALYVFLDIVLI